jgi:homocysteine S-methyltransferase
MRDIRAFLEQNTLLFDGGMGVYYSQLYSDGSSEQANLLHPERISAIHRAYLDAGAMAIKTNTFAANTVSLDCSMEQAEENIRAAWTIAQQAAAGRDVYIFADIGPLPGFEPDTAEYTRIVDLFLELGAAHFLFETFSDLAVQPKLAARIKRAAPEAFVLVSFGAMAEGFTPAGFSVSTLLRQASACPDIDAAGLNCVIGPSSMVKLVSGLRQRPALLSVMPNASYPTAARGHIRYGGDPDFFAGRMAELQAMGVKILGGCCGTTPAFIEKTAAALQSAPAAEAPHVRVETRRPRAKNRLSDKLDAGERVIALELDPPMDDDIDFFIDGARRLQNAGADAITIADCPIARARADSSMLAAKLHRELGIDPIPHMTCRDRNINATRALLLGLSIEDVHNVLLVTGDPVPTSEREKIKAVYSYSSAVLAAYVRTLGEEGSVAPFRIFGALNVNAPIFAAELRKAQRKELGGVTGFLTQPVFTDRAFENLAQAHETLSSPILGGIYPLVSHRNAQFMNAEVAGVQVSQEIIDRYAGLDRAAAEDLAVELAADIARRMLPCTAGWYLMTPFKRVELMERVLGEVTKLKKTP